MAEHSGLKLWAIKYHLAMQDPGLPGPRHHTAIFVETNARLGNGYLHQVIGGVTSVGGMKYSFGPAGRPEDEDGFCKKIFLGYADAALYPDK